MRVPHRAPGAHRSVGAETYHGTDAPRASAKLALLAVALIPVLAAGGCSMSMELGSLFSGKSEESADTVEGDPDVTGSLPLQPARAGSPEARMTSADWTFATAALREAMQYSGADASIPWQNPATDARGTVTPISSAFIQDGFSCRNFLASYVGDGREGWFEGTACRVHRGRWDVRTARPLQKS